ncbi:prepilin-type N-terminal cleavage/methylation domain-containing protein [Tenuibacillus multivorans]|uniref:Type IV pilus assembly protein PilA n=1 Tax=Tenuibacillus multivorans TaxID=237069 RepID=A0A1H0FZE8_9BACI|nr:prepilin-type N-terminal cleavage/methylation domain-containing protein [Tenuibacillus multivorans]GEL78145.1 hypothetical protein TMU01_23800 [Tenuibacillus multivorans]SDO00015.1 type IV pilus assembly protein PilA [Tenuibacillus multivorans]
MFKMSKSLIKKEKGVTLVELLAVIIILGIIALIAVPAIAGVIEDSKVDSIKSSAINYINAGELYSVTNDISNDSIDLKTLFDDGYVDDKDTAIWNNFGDSSGRPQVEIDTDGNITITATGSMDGITVQFEGASISDINEGDDNDNVTVTK